MVVKTAISLPEELFSELQARATELGLSRSRVLADALRAYLRALETEALRRGLAAAYPEGSELDEEDRAWLSWAHRRAAVRLNEEDGGYDAQGG